MADRGDIIELTPPTAKWAGYRFGRVVKALADGDVFVAGDAALSDQKFVGAGNYMVVGRLHVPSR